MQLEISYPHDTLNQYEIDKLKKQLLFLHNYDKEISKAEIILKKLNHAEIISYLCEIIISIYGNNFSYNKEGDSYEEAIRYALHATEGKIDELIKYKNDLPEEYVSTVKV